MLENRFSTHSKTLRHTATHCRALQHTRTHSNAPSFHCAHVYMLIHRRNLHLLIGLLAQWYVKTGARQNMYLHNIHICIHVYIYIQVYMYIHMHKYVYICIHTGSIFIMYRATRKPVHDNTPRLVYSFFFYSFRICYSAGLSGYLLILLDFFQVLCVSVYTWGSEHFDTHMDTFLSFLIFPRFYVYLCIREWVCILIRTWIPSHFAWFLLGSMYVCICVRVYILLYIHTPISSQQHVGWLTRKIMGWLRLLGSLKL